MIYPLKKTNKSFLAGINCLLVENLSQLPMKMRFAKSPKFDALFLFFFG